MGEGPQPTAGVKLAQSATPAVPKASVVDVEPGMNQSSHPSLPPTAPQQAAPTLRIPNTPGRQDEVLQSNLAEDVSQATTAGAGDGERSAEHSTDTIQFTCSACAKVVSVLADKAGKTGKCPTCGVALQIPQTRDYYKRTWSRRLTHCSRRSSYGTKERINKF